MDGCKNYLQFNVKQFPADMLMVRSVVRKQAYYKLNSFWSKDLWLERAALFNSA